MLFEREAVDMINPQKVHILRAVAQRRPFLPTGDICRDRAPIHTKKRTDALLNAKVSRSQLSSKCKTPTIDIGPVPYDQSHL